MNTGRFVPSQISELLHGQSLERDVSRYRGRESSSALWSSAALHLYAVRTVNVARRLGGDRDECLNAEAEAIYHLDFLEAMARSTLAEANEAARLTAAARPNDAVKRLRHDCHPS
jgi:hypothetical protein